MSNALFAAYLDALCDNNWYIGQVLEMDEEDNETESAFNAAGTDNDFLSYGKN